MYRQLSLVREKMEKYSEALDSLEKAGELAQQGYGNTIEVLFQQARIKEKLELWPEALDDYEKIHLYY
jgi:tetratricopeptide (TPR) repeat protein